MKTVFYHPKAEWTEKLKRITFYLQLTFICLVLPVLFLIGIKGNERNTPPAPVNKQIFHFVPQNGEAIVDFRPILSDKQS